MQQQRSLQDAWLSTLTDLGAADGVDTLLMGPYAESLADQLPAPAGDTTSNVATLRVTPVPDGAVPTATGFPGGADRRAGREGSLRRGAKTRVPPTRTCRAG